MFTGRVELAGIIFTGEPAKTKKQAEKNAAMAAWWSLKQLSKETASTSSETENNDELEQITIARALINYRLKEKVALANSPSGSIPFTKKFQIQNLRATSPQPPPVATSKILPLFCQKAASRVRPSPTSTNDRPLPVPRCPSAESPGTRLQKFPAARAAPYVPIQQLRAPCHSIAPPVTIRTVTPVYAAPLCPPPSARLPAPVVRASPVGVAPPVCARQAVPVFAAPLAQRENPPTVYKEPSFTSIVPCDASLPVVEERKSAPAKQRLESEVAQKVKELEI